MFGATPRLRLISAKRRRPRKTSRMTSRRPALADDGERSGDRAVLLAERAVRHGSSVAQSVAFCYRPRATVASWLQNATDWSRMQRRWKVLTLVSVGIFMVEPRPLHREHRLPRHRSATSPAPSVSDALLGPQRLRDRLRGAAGPGRPPGRPPSGASASSCGASRSSCSARRCAALAPSVDALIGARVVQAAGAALHAADLARAAAARVPADAAPAAIGIWAAVGGLAAAAGPPIGGLLVRAELALVFLVNVPIGLIAAIVYGMRAAAREPRRAQERPDLLGAALLARRRRRARARPRQGRPTGAGPTRARSARSPRPRLGLAAFWARCLTHRSPVIDPALLRVRSFAIANLASRVLLRRLRARSCSPTCCS